MTLPNSSSFVALWRTGGISDHLAIGQSHGRHRRTDRDTDSRGLHQPARCLDLVLPTRAAIGWKHKHQDLKATIKGFKNQIAAVTKSREQWRLKAEQASERVSALEAEVGTACPGRQRG